MAAAHGTLWYSATVSNCAQTKQHEMMDVVLPYRTATSSMKTTSSMAGTLLLTPTLAIRYPCTRADGDGTTMDRCCASRCLGAWRHAHEQHRKLTFLSFQLTFLSCAEAHHTGGLTGWGAGGGGRSLPLLPTCPRQLSHRQPHLTQLQLSWPEGIPVQGSVVGLGILLRLHPGLREGILRAKNKHRVSRLEPGRSCCIHNSANRQVTDLTDHSELNPWLPSCI